MKRLAQQTMKFILLGIISIFLNSHNITAAACALPADSCTASGTDFDLIFKSQNGNEPHFHLFIQSNDITSIQMWLGKLTSLDREKQIEYLQQKNSKGQTALDLAIQCGLPQDKKDEILRNIAKILCCKHRLITQENVDDLSLFHYGALMGSSTLIRYCLDAGMNPYNGGNKRKITVWHCAAANGLEIFNLLPLPQDATSPAISTLKDCTEATLLHYAARFGTIEMVDHLLTTYPELKNIKTTDGFSPLHVAACEHSTAMMDHLIAKGYDINDTDKNGATPLHYAAELGTIEMVDHLLTTYPELKNIKTRNCLSPLQLAACGHSTVMVDLLIAKGYDINGKDKNGRTLLHFAARFGTIEMVDHLLTNYPELKNITTSDDASPLLEAINGDSTSMIDHLIARGYDPNERDMHGRTLLDYATGRDTIKMVEHLFDLGISADFDGIRPLCGDAQKKKFKQFWLDRCELTSADPTIPEKLRPLYIKLRSNFKNTDNSTIRKRWAQDQKIPHTLKDAINSTLAYAVDRFLTYENPKAIDEEVKQCFALAAFSFYSDNNAITVCGIDVGCVGPARMLQLMFMHFKPNQISDVFTANELALLQSPANAEKYHFIVKIFDKTKRDLIARGEKLVREKCTEEEEHDRACLRHQKTNDLKIARERIATRERLQLEEINLIGSLEEYARRQLTLEEQGTRALFPCLEKPTEEPVLAAPPTTPPPAPLNAAALQASSPTNVIVRTPKLPTQKSPPPAPTTPAKSLPKLSIAAKQGVSDATTLCLTPRCQSKIEVSKVGSDKLCFGQQEDQGTVLFEQSTFDLAKCIIASDEMQESNYQYTRFKDLFSQGRCITWHPDVQAQMAWEKRALRREQPSTADEVAHGFNMNLFFKALIHGTAYLQLKTRDSDDESQKNLALMIVARIQQSDFPAAWKIQDHRKPQFITIGFECDNNGVVGRCHHLCMHRTHPMDVLFCPMHPGDDKQCNCPNLQQKYLMSPVKVLCTFNETTAKFDFKIESTTFPGKIGFLTRMKELLNTPGDGNAAMVQEQYFGQWH